ncbi:hypothetical protein [Brevundimonas sp. A19_0]|uniref:hypothetical protein n=1 Tax=Brevundimonas sp. A19_0 TaxID=2821087 RepID=UPI001ADCE767|nr:hypothetical protein [Brevundimonas sp. A19_0]MBO9500791.1 hypothetical protein [Brevundimonas sp. A19_0]
MLTVKQLSAHLEALALPDSPVFFSGEDGRPVLIMGGIARDHAQAPGGKIVNLAPTKLDQVGGF